MGDDSSSLSHVPSLHPRRTFDVFISFRGEDTRNNFTSHLYFALCKKKVDTFIDDRLDRGDEISEALVQAIKGSKASLVVLSENYAFSRWCLNELVEILECKDKMGQLVIPIFYRVDPANVRGQKESYAAAFAKHEERYKDKMEKVNQWRSALREVADLSGWNSSVVKPDSMLVDKVVKDTVKKLNCISYRSNLGSYYTIFKGLVGIDLRVKKVLNLLGFGSPGFRIVGIWGMGGIGKTTVAEAVFNQISGEFEGSYFFRNVRETEQKDDLVRRRDELLAGILEEENLHIGTSNIQPDFVVDRLRRKRVLVVLDDLNDPRQLETLFGGLDLFGAGSRVIITTRDKQLLNSFNITEVYDVERLNDVEALQLFCHYALLLDHQTESYNELAKRVVDYARGIPLALKVFGSSLRGKDKLKWESALNKLKKVPNLKLRDMLKVSYDGLEDEEIKDIFLDIACFFKGQDVDHATKILDACYLSVTYGISVLVDKSLITILRNKIEMQDMLQELGWDIVKQECKSEPGRRSRLWIAEDVHHVLKRNTGTETIRGIFLDLSKVKEIMISPDIFEKMYNLKLLKFYGGTGVDTKVYPPHGLKSLPDELRYLCWHGYPLKCLPPAFWPENLVELDMSYSNLTQLWSGTQNFVSLKIINLVESKKLKEVPDLSQVTNLESLHLGGCESLVSIPSSIRRLNKLLELDLRDCKKLRSLPRKMNLRSLTTLNLTGCGNVANFPEISTNVQYLHLSETAIQELPSYVERLSKLVDLRLNSCIKLKNLPGTLQNLDSLRNLYLRHCRSLTELPVLSAKIECLYLEDTGIEEIPASIVGLFSLQQLFIRNCKRLRSLPSSIWKLKSLRGLYLSGCSKLESLPEIMDTMESLFLLELSGTAVKELPSSIERLVSLEVLMLENCKTFSKFPDTLWNLKKLRHVIAHGTAIKRLQPFPIFLINLKYLYISGCDSRVPTPLSLPPLSNLHSLNSLRLKDLHIVHVPEDIGCLVLLERLDLSGNDFETLPCSIKLLSKLRWLSLSYCRRLKSLPELQHGLLNLDAHDCASLRTMSSDLEFLIVGVNGMCIFSNCFKLDEDVCGNILNTAKLRFQHKAEETMLGRRHFLTCLPGNELPDWFSYRSNGPSITFQLPGNWYSGNFTGFALCVAVAFTDYFSDTNFSILCEYCYESNDGDCLENRTFFFPWKGFEIQDQFSSSNSQSQLKAQHRYIGSDHIFLLYNESIYHDAVQENGDSNSFYDSVAFNFSILDEAYKPLDCCEVKKCGCYMLQSSP